MNKWLLLFVLHEDKKCEKKSKFSKNQYEKYLIHLTLNSLLWEKFSQKKKHRMKRKEKWKKEEKSFNWTEEDSMSVKKQSEKEEIKKKFVIFITIIANQQVENFLFTVYKVIIIIKNIIRIKKFVK